MKWKKRDGGEWLLLGTVFSVHRDKSDGRWDICESGSYLCTARYVETAKSICERIAKGGK